MAKNSKKGVVEQAVILNVITYALNTAKLNYANQDQGNAELLKILDEKTLASKLNDIMAYTLNYTITDPKTGEKKEVDRIKLLFDDSVKGHKKK